MLGAVTIKMKSENHYEVGSSGITERMPSSEKQAAEWTWVESATAYGDIRDLKSTYKMEDKYAKKDGEDAHVKVVTKFWRYDPKVGTTAAASFSERLKVKLVKNDKKAKVTHSWQML